jgi:hypothetical protein
VLSQWGYRLRSIRFAVLVLLGLASIAAYAMTAAFNGEPSAQPFRGWVAALESSEGLLSPPPDPSVQQDQVRLSVSAPVPGAPGSHPEVLYRVSVCGGQPFDGLLIAGGDARLTGAHVIAASEPGAAFRVKDILDAAVELGPGRGLRVELGPIQIMTVTFPRPIRCAATPAAVSPFGQGPSNQVVESGSARGPIRQDSGLPWWSGPRSIQRWPLVGALPGLPPELQVLWTGVKGLSGQWLRPKPDYVQVSSAPPADTSIEDAEPQTVSRLAWEGIEPMQPTARMSSVGATNSWQQGQVITGIALGIFGSLMATWLLLGRPAEDATVAQIRAGLKAIQGELDARVQLATVTAERDAARAALEAERHHAAERVEELRRNYEDRIAELSRRAARGRHGARRRNPAKD